MHIDRLGLFSHLYGTLLDCLSMCPGSWVGTTTLCIELEVVHCTIAVSAWCSAHQLVGCECTGNRSCAYLLGAKMVQIWAYMAICSHIYMYLHAYTSFKYMYTSYYIFMYVYLYLNASIYADNAYIGAFWLTFGFILHQLIQSKKYYCNHTYT